MISWLTVERGDCPPPEGVLGPEELAYYAGLRTEKRKHDWLLGRTAAKRLVLRQLGVRGAALPLAAIRVVSEIDGSPRVVPAGLALADLALCAELASLSISISHTEGRSLCAIRAAKSVAGGRLPVAAALGADIERILPRGRGFAVAYYTPAELALLGATPIERYDTLSTAIWSAKEALLKFTRHGLRVDTRTVTCLPAPPERDGWAPVAITTELTGVPVVGWWRVYGECVITIAASVGRAGALGVEALPRPRLPFAHEEEQCRTI
ncbi:MAG: 4'-phosphopantetheinyl transferase superfamily protein [Chloroflexales bacterium]